VNVITSTATAQYGGGNVVNLISKSGTNQFHGSLYEYFQNDAFNARDYFNRPPSAKAKQCYNYFGGWIGGPIVQACCINHSAGVISNTTITGRVLQLTARFTF
jgi:hypothetical protein